MPLYMGEITITVSFHRENAAAGQENFNAIAGRVAQAVANDHDPDRYVALAKWVLEENSEGIVRKLEYSREEII